METVHPAAAAPTTSKRKDAHLDLCATQQVEPAYNSALFDCVHLLHCAMPELSMADIDLSTSLFGRRLSLPLCITGMTGGTARARDVNEALAAVAQEYNIAFGVGSQRAMHENPACIDTYAMRRVAPKLVLIGNIGLVQAMAMGVDAVRRLADDIEADGMALHLNPAQELIQSEGDRDFRIGYKTVEALARAFGSRLMVKETGCGLSPEVAGRLFDCGVRTFDVSGLGGTSWVKVEQLRAEGVAREVGASFSGWGLPTAAATHAVRRALGAEPFLIASGGVRSGLEVAKAVALGADMAGMALPVYRAYAEEGYAGAQRALERIGAELRTAFLLTGSRDVAAMRRQKFVATGPLTAWLDALER